VVNTETEHIRFRYLHMSPNKMDQDKVLSGRRVNEGEVIGQVGNYSKREGGTSYHLHFDIQVPTRDGWVFVNPYMTLVASYERLIGGRGEEISDVMPEIAVAAPVTTTIGPPQDQPLASVQDRSVASVQDRPVASTAPVASTKPVASIPIASIKPVASIIREDTSDKKSTREKKQGRDKKKHGREKKYAHEKKKSGKKFAEPKPKVQTVADRDALRGGPDIRRH
jgi:hypothetical protein